MDECIDALNFIQSVPTVNEYVAVLCAGQPVTLKKGKASVRHENQSWQVTEPEEGGRAKQTQNWDELNSKQQQWYKDEQKKRLNSEIDGLLRVMSNTLEDRAD